MPNGKTITTRKIDIRSPEGKLLSSTVQKTISYGKDAVLPPDPFPGTDEKTTLEPKSEHCNHECKHEFKCDCKNEYCKHECNHELKCNCKHGPKHEHSNHSLRNECKHKCRCQHNDDQMSERTELVDLNQTRDFGDSTIYGDKWSNASSTLRLRRSRLLPNHCAQSNVDSRFVSDLIWELNRERRRNGVQSLKAGERLMLEAQRQAERMAKERRIRLDDRMNVWIGRSPRAHQIAGEWFSEMINWTHNYFKMPYLKLVGVGVEILECCGGDPHRSLHLIVVVYD